MYFKLQQVQLKKKTNTTHNRNDNLFLSLFIHHDRRYFIAEVYAISGPLYREYACHTTSDHRLSWLV